MVAIQWDEKQFATGHVVVDQQHRDLFKMVNELHDAIVAQRSREVLVPTLERLAKYTVEHFQTEQDLMTSLGYPEYAAHKQRHDELTAKVVELIEGYRSARITLPVTLSRFLSDWLNHHIKGEDKRMIEWIRQNKGSPAPAGAR